MSSEVLLSGLWEMEPSFYCSYSFHCFFSLFVSGESGVAGETKYLFGYRENEGIERENRIHVFLY